MDNEELEGMKFSEFPSQTPVNADEVVGLHSGDNARFSIANIVAAVRNGLENIFVPKTDVGAADGVASLDSNSKVPGTQLDLSGKQDTITANGILKGDGAGGVSAATAGTDYQTPLTAGTDYATPAQLADKAAKADLTNIQATGITNTTGAVIPAGALFYLNGILHRANTQIDVNATFTPGTNCEQTTVGDELAERLYAIFSPASLLDVHSGGTIPIEANTPSLNTYKYVVLRLTTSSSDVSSSRGVVMAPLAAIRTGPYIPAVVGGVSGWLRISASSDYKSFVIISTSFASLYLATIYGII